MFQGFFFVLYWSRYFIKYSVLKLNSPIHFCVAIAAVLACVSFFIDALKLRMLIANVN